MNQLTERKANRFRALKALYEATGGSRHATLFEEELAERVGLSQEATSSAVEYLVGEGLAQHVAIGEIGITHSGVREVERAIAEPEKETRYFPPINFMYVQSAVNSQLQQGTAGSHQILSATQGDLSAVRDFLEELSARLDSAGLTAGTLQEARAEVASVEAQLQSPKPKTGIIVEGLRSIRAILEGAAANAVASDLLPKLLPLLASLQS